LQRRRATGEGGQKERSFARTLLRVSLPRFRRLLAPPAAGSPLAYEWAASRERWGRADDRVTRTSNTTSAQRDADVARALPTPPPFPSCISTLPHNATPFRPFLGVSAWEARVQHTHTQRAEGQLTPRRAVGRSKRTRQRSRRHLSPSPLLPPSTLDASQSNVEPRTGLPARLRRICSERHTALLRRRRRLRPQGGRPAA
jgi:hypothetical protein